MARRLGKVESKKQSKAEKGNKKKFGIIQQNANSKKSSTNPQTASPDKNNLNKDDDDSKLDSRIKTIAARRHGRVEAMKEARVDMASEGNHSSTPPVNTELSINKRSTSSANSDINDNIDECNSNDPKLINSKMTVMARRSGRLEAMKQARAEESAQKDIHQPKKKDRLKLSRKKKSDPTSIKPPSGRRLRSDVPKHTLRNRQVNL